MDHIIRELPKDPRWKAEDYKSYKQNVEFAEKWLFGDKAVRHVGKDSVMLSYNSLRNESPGTQVMQLMHRYHLRMNIRICLDLDLDIITAFYIPKDLEYFKIYINRVVVATCRIDDQPSVELEELLRCATEVPADALENLLGLARGTDSDHSLDHRSEMTIEGVDYRRVVPIHPFIPFLGMYMYYSIYIEAGSPCTVYYEGSTIHSEARNSYQKLHNILYSPTTDTVLRNGCNDGDIHRPLSQSQMVCEPLPLSIPDHSLDIIRPQN
jgi:hypothetical protein